MAAGLTALALAAAVVAEAQPARSNWRWEEDWSLLADPAYRTGAWWEPAKYVPLAADVSLSTGLEARIRYEGFDNNLWGAAEAPDDNSGLARLMPHVEVRAGPFRAFVQGLASYATGVRPSAGPVEQTGVELLQGFVDLQVSIGGRGALVLRAGRSLVPLGSERLVGIRYGPNTPLAFDGLRATATVDGMRVDLFDLQPVDARSGSFNDRGRGVERLRGLYATAALGGGAGADLYVLAYRDRNSDFAGGTGPERRTSWGLRLFGTRADWSWNWELMIQRGRHGLRRIRAWSLATETGYRLSAVRFAPTLRLRANIASGDRDPEDGRSGTFNALFPKGRYFGELTPIGPYNIANLHPSVELELTPAVRLSLSGIAYWRASRGDGLYDLPGQRIVPAGRSRARFVGAQGEALLDWEVTPLLVVSGSISVFTPGAFLDQTTPGETIRMIAGEATFRF